MIYSLYLFYTVKSLFKANDWSITEQIKINMYTQKLALGFYQQLYNEVSFLNVIELVRTYYTWSQYDLKDDPYRVDDLLCDNDSYIERMRRKEKFESFYLNMKGLWVSYCVFRDL